MDTAVLTIGVCNCSHNYKISRVISTKLIAQIVEVLGVFFFL